MANKTAKRNQLIAKRAQALALMYLTGRADVAVDDAGDGAGIDVIVRLEQRGTGVRQFGVAVRGALAAITAEQADETLRPFVTEVRRTGPFPFPVCLFFFTMEKTEGWFTWVVEPAIAAENSVRLAMAECSPARPLNDEAVDEIVDRVNRWYDAFFAGLATKPSGAKHKNGKSA